MSTTTINDSALKEVHGIELNGRTVTLLVGQDEQQEDSEARQQCRHKARSQCVITKMNTKNTSNNNMSLVVDERIFKCGLKGCGKWSHLLCFSKMITEKETALCYYTCVQNVGPTFHFSPSSIRCIRYHF